MACWKDAPETARAVTAAMLILAKAGRVVIVAVGEGDKSVTDSANAVASQLASHRGVEAAAENFPPRTSSRWRRCGCLPRKNAALVFWS